MKSETVYELLCQMDYPDVSFIIHQNGLIDVYDNEEEIYCLDKDILNTKVKKYDTEFRYGTCIINIYI